MIFTSAGTKIRINKFPDNLVDPVNIASKYFIRGTLNSHFAP